MAGRVPYGYVADRNSEQLIIDRTEAKRFGKIFELAVSGKPPCRNVSLRPFEIEYFICSMFEQSEVERESSANTPLKAIRSSWHELNMRTQTNLLATIIKEVIFDPDAGSIVVTLVDDAAERIMSAKSNGCSTR